MRPVPGVNALRSIFSGGDGESHPLRNEDMYALLRSVEKNWYRLIFVYFGSGLFVQGKMPMDYQGLQEFNCIPIEEVIKLSAPFQAALIVLCEINVNQYEATALHPHAAFLQAPLKNRANHNQDGPDTPAEQLAYTIDMKTVSDLKWTQFENLFLDSGATRIQHHKTEVSKVPDPNKIVINELPPVRATRSGGGFVAFLVAGSVTYLSTRQYLMRKRLRMSHDEKTKYQHTPPIQGGPKTPRIPDTLSIEVPDKGHLLSPQVIHDIWNQLNRFERDAGYLDKEVDLAKLAVRFKTNQWYLSHVINHYKKMAFPSYLKSLRIENAKKRLLEEPKLHRYNLEGLADQFGFKSGRAFSTAFSEITGSPPSKLLERLRARNRLQNSYCKDDS